MRALRVSSVVALLACAGLAAGQSAGEALTMWGGEAPPRGTLTSVSVQGVEVMGGDGTPMQLGWDRVREVTGERADAFEALRANAVSIWRAASRLERGDTVNAEPILEALFEKIGWERGAASSLVTQGLLRCKSEHGSRAAAVVPWLGVLNAEGWAPGADRERASGLIDTETGLAPGLPPVWLNNAQSIRMSRETFDGAAWEGDSAAERLRLLGEIYRLSASFELAVGNEASARDELGSALEGVSGQTLSEDGVALVLEIVLARIGNEEQRAASRSALESRLRARPVAWKEAWIRSGIGRSLLREPSPEARRRGVIQLLHVPARFGDVTPGLASLALAESALTLRSLGRIDEAGSLRRELLERYPGSEGAMLDPIVAWVRSSQLGAPAEAPTKNAAHGGTLEGTIRS